MADDRSPRRRKRTFSTTSTISTDDYQDASEQIVEDITLEFFYKPRSITALACLFAYLVYSAFTRNPDATREDNIWSGIVSLAVVFLVLSLLVMPNGPFIRPHPAIWRFIFGASVLYLLFLTFALFQTRDDFRKILFFFDPKLEQEGPDTKVFFTHLLPNFEECWWDALVLDFLVCNGLGIHFGLYVCNKLEMRNYHWESIKDIHTTTGKLRRAVLQFTPASWTHIRWMDPKCSYMRYFAICQMMIISQIVELNTFFLKHILWVPTAHWLNVYRLGLIAIIVAPSLRQYYVYVTDTRSRRLGTQAWVLIAITCMEGLICVKYGLDMFKKTEIVSIVLWLLFQMAISIVVLYFMVMTKSKEGEMLKKNIVEKLAMFKKYGTKKPIFLEEIPAEDPSTITMNYVKTNGNHILQDHSVAHRSMVSNGFHNGSVVNVSHPDAEEQSKKSSTKTAPMGAQDQRTTKRRSRRSAVGESMGGNFEMTTRLRARQSQSVI
ncbi:phosphatidylserine synthase 1-like isoform X3 [Montipora capricornis]|uniref:phosphatidylserine synthase 1-like isoform X3 n=1 Tax=Montipora capricornis TaxID=246305 RepID=UPI0035F17F89